MNVGLSQDLAIRLPGLFVCPFGLTALSLRDLGHLLTPALVNRFQAPFGALTGGSNRLLIDCDEDRVRV
jgi:hypothetical protein